MTDYAITEAIASAVGLEPAEREAVRRLVTIWRDKLPRNELRDRYYLSHVPANDLGVSVSPELASRIDARVDWPAKAVDYLAARSQFDGFSADDPETQARLLAIASRNSLGSLYRKALVCELKHCCAALAVTSDALGRAVVSAYPMTACALEWDDAQKEVARGLVVAESRPTYPGSATREPSVVKLFTAGAVVTMRKGPGGAWSASREEIAMGRPLIEPMAYRATLERPFGRSRITRAVMSIADDAMREKVRSEIAAEFAAYPQKYLMGTDQRMIPQDSRYAAYIGAILEVTKGDDGTVPNFGQLPQISMQPHVEYMRALAAQFSGATNVPLSALGVVSDNPSSAEAIYAAKEDLVIEAQELNKANGRALVNVATLALATELNVPFSSVRDSGAEIVADFRSPAMPSVVSQSDAMVKQISVLPWLAESDVALEELGYDEAKRRRLASDRAKAQSRALVAQATAGTGLSVAGNPDGAGDANEGISSPPQVNPRARRGTAG